MEEELIIDQIEKSSIYESFCPVMRVLSIATLIIRLMSMAVQLNDLLRPMIRVLTIANLVLRLTSMAFQLANQCFPNLS